TVTIALRIALAPSVQTVASLDLDEQPVLVCAGVDEKRPDGLDVHFSPVASRRATTLGTPDDRAHPHRNSRSLRDGGGLRASRKGSTGIEAPGTGVAVFLRGLLPRLRSPLPAPVRPARVTCKRQRVREPPIALRALQSLDAPRAVQDHASQPRGRRRDETVS